MLRLTLLVSVSFVVVGCGEGFRITNDGIVDPEFKPYVDKFLEHADILETNVDVYFNDQTGNVIGLCKIRGDYRRVEIDGKWWSTASDLNREILIFHELAHCVLGQVHRNSKLDDECSGSVMDVYYIGARCYDLHYNYYIGELFNAR